MKAFTTYEDRDAWFVIRGYVYQVHVTIFEWLSLQRGSQLLLECGEDIDHVQEDLVRRESDDAASVNLIWPLLIFSFGPTLW
jgi:hypothetical protein